MKLRLLKKEMIDMTENYNIMAGKLNLYVFFIEKAS
jgi:hypothetical protein